jgi:hypothetical protein
MSDTNMSQLIYFLNDLSMLCLVFMFVLVFHNCLCQNKIIFGEILHIIKFWYPYFRIYIYIDFFYACISSYLDWISVLTPKLVMT